MGFLHFGIIVKAAEFTCLNIFPFRKKSWITNVTTCPTIFSTPHSFFNLYFSNAYFLPLQSPCFQMHEDSYALFHDYANLQDQHKNSTIFLLISSYTIFLLISSCFGINWPSIVKQEILFLTHFHWHVKKLFICIPKLYPFCCSFCCQLDSFRSAFASTLSSSTETSWPL